jgi:UDP-N-acetylglucosamine 2-epimerase (non-hydrolysing)
MLKILVVFGTRPEAIKMAPLVKRLKDNSRFEIKVCVTAQHRELLDQVLRLFEIIPEYDLNLMKENQSLNYLTSTIITDVSKVIDEFNPNYILVHGDTTTSFAAALAAFNKKVMIGHVEAGLRTYNLDSPFPEEANRQLISRIASIHFSPTLLAQQNLINEGISEKNIFVTGNTVIDALKIGINSISTLKNEYTEKLNYFLHKNDKLILVTTHRRENFGKPLLDILKAIKFLVNFDKSWKVIFSVHPNPNIQQTVKKHLSSEKNVFLTEPLDYLSFLYTMKNTKLILTDSGGVQEEGSSLQIPILVLRNETEREEILGSALVKLVGSNYDLIVENSIKYLNEVGSVKNNPNFHPFGDGTATLQIESILEKQI